jgi:uncharacterized protein YjiS (DUF1127 family)
MTTYDHRLAGGTGAPALHPGIGIGRRLRAALKAIQYGQMVSVLNRLPDEHLAEAGLRRSDIPAQARRSVYGDR